MFSYRFTLSYDGTKYNGWQKQGNTDNTIQGKLENMFSRLLEEEIEVHGAGRTDAGVHALGQVIHIHCKNDLLEDKSFNECITLINGYLPVDIRITSMEKCDLRFHARLNAMAKTYRYTIDTSLAGNVFNRNYVYHLPEKLNIEAMKGAAAYFLGEHDFKSFTSNKKMKKSSVRTIYSIDIETKSQGIIEINYRGNGFLYNMVRIITGTLIEIGQGKRRPESIPEILAGLNRELAGPMAPAAGLTMIEVEY